MFKNLFRKKFNPLSKRDELIVVAVSSVTKYKEVLLKLSNNINGVVLDRTGFEEILVSDFLVDSNGYVISNSMEYILTIKKLARNIEKQIKDTPQKELANIVQVSYKKLVIDNALKVCAELSK